MRRLPSLSNFFYAATRAVFKVTMSFGFSVGDIIAVAGLANKIRQRFLDAPEEFKAISAE
jgi:hypothetical protein